MLLRAAVLAVFLNAGAFGSWERHVGLDVGEWSDIPSAHPLAYFRNSACAGHSPSDRLSKRCTARTRLKLVGQIGKFSIYDLNYYFDHGYEPPGTVGAKAILVRSGPDTLREIYLRQLTQMDASIPPTQLLSAGKERILVATYNDGGMYRSFSQDFIGFTSSGNSFMSLDPIREAAKQHLPSDAEGKRNASSDTP